MLRLRSMIRRCVLKPRIFWRSSWSKPVMTLMTMISTATPKVTPTTEIKVMTETNVRLGRRYRKASNSSKGRPDMRRQAKGREGGCQRAEDAEERGSTKHEDPRTREAPNPKLQEQSQSSIFDSRG